MSFVEAFVGTLIYIVIYVGYFMYKIRLYRNFNVIIRNIKHHEIFWKIWYIFILTQYFIFQPFFATENIFYPYKRNDNNLSKGLWPYLSLKKDLYNYANQYNINTNDHPGWYLQTCITNIISTFISLHVLSVLIQSQTYNDSVYIEFRSNLRCLILLVFSMTVICINALTIVFDILFNNNGTHFIEYNAIIFVYFAWIFIPLISILLVYFNLNKIIQSRYKSVTPNQVRQTEITELSHTSGVSHAETIIN